jgi:hypothetical protein
MQQGCGCIGERATLSNPGTANSSASFRCLEARMLPNRPARVGRVAGPVLAAERLRSLVTTAMIVGMGSGRWSSAWPIHDTFPLVALGKAGPTSQNSIGGERGRRDRHAEISRP